MADQPPHIPSDPREWRPQTADISGRGVAYIDNPVAEPVWSGERVLVLYRDADDPNEWGSVEVIGEGGDEALERARRAFDQLRRSILARDAVIDGIITGQTVDPGVSMEFDESRAGLGNDLAFVVVDLLRIDGTTLFDIPLLERKRLLEGLIQQSPLVRVSPWVTPPIHPWLRTWRGAGFKGAIVKGANSRYTPGSMNIEWAVVERF
jgi:bifunctional non-homologous end joining protein LigD